MFNIDHLIVRRSGIKQESFYIDYFGHYTIAELSKETGIRSKSLTKLFVDNSGELDEERNIYYFKSEISAKIVVAFILNKIAPAVENIKISFTPSQIEYIRKSVINYSQSIGTDSKITGEVLDKLNGK